MNTSSLSNAPQKPGLDKNQGFWLAHCLLLLVLLIGAACAPLAPSTPPPPSPTVDPLAAYKQDLLPAFQGDLNSIDHPTRYDLTLTYDPAGPTLSGTESASFTNRQSVDLSEVYFRLFANYPGGGSKITVSRTTVDGAAADTTLEAQDTALKVPMAKPLAPGAQVNIQLDFSVSIPRTAPGHYADLIADPDVTTLPSVYPLIPAYDSKGWHLEVPPPFGDLVYANVSFYTASITAPSSENLIVSGSTVSSVDNSNGTKTWRIVGAPMRDFDINFTDKLQKTSGKVGSVTINSWYEPKDAQGGADALKFATDAFTDYQKRFGDYPYDKLDVVATPTTAGGIEYPSVIVINRDLYSGAAERRGAFEFTVVHEVAHQWWYGVVGDDQVNYPWVDETLAQYSSLIYYQDIHGQSAAQQIMRQVFLGPYERAKAAGQDTAVNQPVAAFNENNYGAIVYDKGPFFYDAIRQKMGDDKFFQFLRNYYQDFRYKIAFPDDILKTAESTCGCDLQPEYQQWILSPSK